MRVEVRQPLRRIEHGLHVLVEGPDLPLDDHTRASATPVTQRAKIERVVAEIEHAQIRRRRQRLEPPRQSLGLAHREPARHHARSPPPSGSADRWPRRPKRANRRSLPLAFAHSWEITRASTMGQAVVPPLSVEWRLRQPADEDGIGG
ncbi:MAG: hypothetical protein R3D25_12360 [Geminicoccaceae bacterium]